MGHLSYSTGLGKIKIAATRGRGPRSAAQQHEETALFGEKKWEKPDEYQGHIKDLVERTKRLFTTDEGNYEAPKQVQSSNVKSIGYKPSKGRLRVQFLNGGDYEYAGVPEETYNKLMNAESHGKAFHRLVRPRFAYRKLDKVGSTFSLSKIGKINSELRPHQKRVRKKMRNQDGLVVAHDMGSGKTLSAIGAAEDERQNDFTSRVKAIVPASLRENFQKEIDKHTDGGLTGGDPEIKSHTKATLDGPDEKKSDLTIVDEAHKARSVGSKFKDVLKKSPSEKKMLMTGTPIYNHPFELGSLVNLASGERKMPETKSKFEEKFVKEKESYPDGLSGLWYRATGGTPEVEKSLKNTDELRSRLSEYVDYHKPDQNNEDFPDVSEETVSVPMSDRQTEIYKYMLDDLPWTMRRKVRKDLSPNKRESGKMMQFLSGPRQVANSINSFEEDVDSLEAGKDSTKVQKIIESVKENPDRKRLIYSNFLEDGIEPMKAVMKEEGIDFAEYTGKTDQTKREKDVNKFNNGEKNNLLVSSAGGEGLDLKGVREAHIMEPHWNEQKINQVISRAKRYKGHSHLPEDEQNLKVKRYETKVPDDSMSNKLKSWFGGEQEMVGSAESYIRQLAEEKEQLNKQVIDMIESETEKSKKENEKEAAVLPTFFRNALRGSASTRKIERFSEKVKGEGRDDRTEIGNLEDISDGQSKTASPPTTKIPTKLRVVLEELQGLKKVQGFKEKALADPNSDTEVPSQPIGDSRLNNIGPDKSENPFLTEENLTPKPEKTSSVSRGTFSISSMRKFANEVDMKIRDATGGGGTNTSFQKINTGDYSYGHPKHKGSPNLPPGIREGASPSKAPSPKVTPQADDAAGGLLSRIGKGFKKIKDDIVDLGLRTGADMADSATDVFSQPGVRSAAKKVASGNDRERLDNKFGVKTADSKDSNDPPKKSKEKAVPEEALSAGAGLGAIGAGAYGAGEFGDDVIRQGKIISPDGFRRFSEFSNLSPKDRSAKNFMREYANRGSRVLGEDMVQLPLGMGKVEGADALESIRDYLPEGVRKATLGRYSELFQGGDTPDDVRSRHYRSFSEGPAQAIAQVYGDMEANEGKKVTDSYGSFQRDIAKSRNDALKKTLDSDGGFNQREFRKNLGDEFSNRLDIDKEEARAFADTVEDRMYKSDSDAYQKYFQNAAEKGEWQSANKAQTSIIGSLYGGTPEQGDDAMRAQQKNIVDKAKSQGFRGVESMEDVKAMPRQKQMELLNAKGSTEDVFQHYGELKSFDNFKKKPRTYDITARKPAQDAMNFIEETARNFSSDVAPKLKSVGKGALGLGALSGGAYLADQAYDTDFGEEGEASTDSNSAERSNPSPENPLPKKNKMSTDLEQPNTSMDMEDMDMDDPLNNFNEKNASDGSKAQMEMNLSDAFETGVYSKKNNEDNLAAATMDGTGSAATIGGLGGATSQGLTGKPFSKATWDTIKDGPENMGRNASQVAEEVGEHMNKSNFPEAGKELSKGVGKRNTTKGMSNAAKKVNWKRVMPNSAKGAVGGALLSAGGLMAANASSYGMGHLLGNDPKKSSGGEKDE